MLILGRLGMCHTFLTDVCNDCVLGVSEWIMQCHLGHHIRSVPNVVYIHAYTRTYTVALKLRPLLPLATELKYVSVSSWGIS